MSDQSFKVRNWRPGSLRFLAVKIGPLSDPETKRDSIYTTTPGASPSIYLCDKGQGPQVLRYSMERGILYSVDGDSQFYYPLLDRMEGAGPGSAFGDSISNGVMVVGIINHRYHWQRKHAGSATESANHWIKLSQLFQDYIWQGAPITAKLATEQFDYYADPAGGVDGHHHKGQLIFTGVIDDFDYDDDRVYLRCIEDRQWDVEFPNSEKPTGGSGPGIITRQAYPYAPDQHIGAAIPMVFSRRGYYGLLNGAKPWAVNPSVLDGLTPSVVTEQAVSTSRLLRVVANKWEAHGAAPAGTGTLFMTHGAFLSEVLGGVNVSTTEAKQDLDHDDTNRLYLPADRYEADSGGVTNPQRAIDGKLDTFASIVHTGTNRTLDLRVPSISPLGAIKHFLTFIVIDGTSVGAGADDGVDNVQFGLWNNATNDWHMAAANTGGKNPGILEKNHVNGGTDKFDSGQWSAGLANDWDAANQPISGWRWQGYNDAAKLSQDLIFRIKVIQNGCTLNVIAAGLIPVFYPVTPVDAGQGIHYSREIKNGPNRVAPGGGLRTR